VIPQSSNLDFVPDQLPMGKRPDLKIFISRLEEIKRAQELDFPPTPGFGKYRPLFSRKAVEHPAKMNTYLLEFLIERYTKEGEVILDPLAGTGSTGVLASLHNRNAILVELEKKFVDWINQAKEKVQTLPTLTPKGEIKVIQGDSRKLSELLANGQTDTVITSPPYAESKPFEDTDFMKRIANDQSEKLRRREIKGHYMSEEARKRTFEKAKDGKYEDKNNISNLPLGNIDTIITSPPYADTPIQDYGTTNKALLEFEAEVRASFKEKGYFEYNGKRYTEEEWRAINKGELKPRGMPELWAAILKNRQDSHYNTGDSKNIGNLPVGDIDTIITSPPYVNATLKKEFKSEEELDKFVKGQKWLLEHGRSEEAIKRFIKKSWMGYPDNPSNIGNLPIGNINTIITSPPYGEQQSPRRGGGNIGFVRPSKDGKIGTDPRDKSWFISDNPDNIANLRHGDINTIITSPPFAEANRGGGIALKGYEGMYGKDEKLHLRHDRPLSDNPENISNLPFGNMGATKKETYLQAMLKVYKEMYSVLKEGGRAIVVVRPFVRNKKVVDLPYDTWLLLEKVGFQLEEVWKLYLKNLSFWRINQYKKNPDQEQIRHEYILVVRK